MAIARFLDRICLDLRASGLWLRYACNLATLAVSRRGGEDPSPPEMDGAHHGRCILGHYTTSINFKWAAAHSPTDRELERSPRHVGGGCGIPRLFEPLSHLYCPYPSDLTCPFCPIVCSTRGGSLRPCRMQKLIRYSCQ